MKWVPDNSGRFRRRPHYFPEELEQICDDAICEFLQQRYGEIRFPVSTADLTVLIEMAVDDFDSSTDLEDRVDGLTDFFPRRKPIVKISARLQESNLENRLRTTLTHEYGHVLLHSSLFTVEANLSLLFGETPKETRNRCYRDKMCGGSSDWMEWQAGFACGALLMPSSRLTPVVKAFREIEDLKYSDIDVHSYTGKRLIYRVMAEFRVSEEAARVRLEQRQIFKRYPAKGLF